MRSVIEKTEEAVLFYMKPVYSNISMLIYCRNHRILWGIKNLNHHFEMAFNAC